MKPLFIAILIIFNATAAGLFVSTNSYGLATFLALITIFNCCQYIVYFINASHH